MLTNLIDLDVGDISPDWQGSTPLEQRIIQRMAKLDGTPRAALYLSKHADDLSDYWYWYAVGVCWVCYSGFVELATWRRLFNAARPGRHSSLMKPSEVRALASLPVQVIAYRAHREDETDWIAYTLDPAIAARFARERGTRDVATYAIRRVDIVALFARRREAEIIVLNPANAVYRGTFTVSP